MSTAQGDCKAGWVQNGDTCYQFKMETADKSSYSEAQRLCSAQGAQLLSVHHDNTHAMVTAYLTANKKDYDGVIWLGLKKVQMHWYLCVCVCVRACAHAFVCVCVGGGGGYVWMKVCVFMS